MLKTPGKGLVSLSYVQRVRESVDVSERVHCTLYTAQHNSVCTYYKPSAPEMRSKMRRYLYVLLPVQLPGSNHCNVLVKSSFPDTTYDLISLELQCE